MMVNSEIALQRMDITRSNGRANTSGSVSILFIYLLFMLVPFNYLITEKFVYYREILAAIYVLFIMKYLFDDHLLLAKLLNNKICLLIMCWVVYLIFCYIIDPEISIYFEDVTQASLKLEYISPKNYVVRNLFLYLPLFILIYIRGLTSREFNTLMIIIFVSSAVSIILYYRFLDEMKAGVVFANLDEGDVGLLTGQLPYNDYVPSLTYGFISGLYLFYYYKRILYKIPIIALLIFIFMNIVLSTGRQSLLFCMIAVISYSFIRRSKMIFIYILVMVAIFFVVMQYDILQSRFLAKGLLSSERYDIMKQGLDLVGRIDAWLIGNGLSAVVYSGPHNNYIRMAQRIGLIGMFLTFWPFFYLFVNQMSAIRRFRKNPGFDLDLAWFIAMGLFFTLFHSFFGYPHEDAFNAPFVWLSLALAMTIGVQKLAQSETSRSLECHS